MTLQHTHTHRTTRATSLRRGLGRTAVAVAGGAVVAAGMLGTTTSANAATGWDEVAACESGGNWSINTGNGYYGGLQFSSQTWNGFGGGQYASTADKASKSQQIAIAEKVLAEQGKGAWPNCGSALSGGADTSGAPSAEKEQEAPKQEAPKQEEKQDAPKQEEKQDAPKQEKKQEAPKQEEKKSSSAREDKSSSDRSEERKSQTPQGDWSCDGDGIADNCDENGFTQKTEKKQQAEKPAQKQADKPAEKRSSEKPAASAGSQASVDLSVAGTLEVDGKMGPETITALQDWLGVEQTGELNEETTLAL